MRKILNYILIAIAILILSIFYFGYTKSGQKNAYRLAGYYASFKLGIPTTIQEINISRFPQIKARITLLEEYQIDLNGSIQNNATKLHYNLHLIHASEDSHKDTDKKIKIKGIITGIEDRLKITGKGHLYNLPLNLHSEIDISNDIYTFDAILKSTDSQLRLTHGIYYKKRKKAKAKYTLDIKDLSLLQKVLRQNLSGALHLAGDINYKEKNIAIDGTSTDLGGDLYFSYKNKKFSLDIKNISLQTLMKRLQTDSMLDANITGKGSYSIHSKTGEFNASLHHAKLIPSTLLKKIETTLSLPIQQEIFNKSNLKIYINDDNMLTSNLTLANDSMQFKLKDITLVDSYNAINTNIDFKTPKYSLEGSLYLRRNIIKKRLPQDYYISLDATVQKYYFVKLDGLLGETFVNIAYALSAKRLPSHICTIVDDINLSGHISGKYDYLHLSGSGKAMEGEVDYSVIKTEKRVQDLELSMKNIHALKLFTLLGQPDFPNGKTDINASFSYLDTSKAKGHINYTLNHGIYKNLPLWLYANIKFKTDKTVRFSSLAKLSTADINITRGKYHLDTNTTEAFYTFKSDNLVPLEPLIGKYKGPFSATGKLSYSKYLTLRGLSQSLGGIIDFLYKKDMLYIDLENVSLERFMKLLDYPHLLNAKINGNINYDYNKEQLLLRADLNHTKFVRSDLVDTIFKKSGINMLKETFPQSTLFAIYQHNILAGDLILKNKNSHFVVKNTQLNTKDNTIRAHFDLRMQGQEFSGGIYGALKNPKIKLNMEKLIRYQMDKQLDSVIGKGNRKLMESMPMGGAAKDVATDMGAGILEMFF